MGYESNRSFNKATGAGFIIAMGIVYGDIGTSPLYTMESIVQGQGGLERISETSIIGALSLIIWTLTLITTVKYLWIALKADNNHEGGIFSLFTLVRKYAKWLIIPAMIGGAALLSDGALTPAVTVTSAIEGLRSIPAFHEAFGQQQLPIVIITLAILAVLFLIQRFGTSIVGKVFGPVMFIWFSFLGITGLINLFSDFSVLQAINPYWAIHLLLSPENKAGIFVLGSVFLATTGAEALYSDLGHVGRGNIHVSWPFVKVCIILSYCGQGAWLLQNRGKSLGDINPFFAVLPQNLIIFSVILATLAAIIASQALISGSFTLVSEAIRLKLLPRLRIFYPGETFGQLYIPAVNLGLWLAASFIVVYFKSSAHMEAAYGLAITVTMLMTTTLLTVYLSHYQKVKKVLVGLFFTVFIFIEGLFFAASAVKFMHGGYVVVIIATMILFVMAIWHKSDQLFYKYLNSSNLNDYKEQMDKLRKDETYDLYHTNVVYLTAKMDKEWIDRSILYSILDKRPKKAKVYWFVKVNVTDEPYTSEYEVDMLGTDFIVCVNLYLGFHMRQEISRYLRTIVTNLMESGRLPQQNQTYSITPGRKVGDFRFIILEEKLINARQMPGFERFVLQTKEQIKKITASPARWFGLHFSEVTVETVPLVLSDVKNLEIHERISEENQGEA
ncbi:KUP/HAK/KT family potassium transporter [Lactococcus lactis]|uniref:Probable potassium transport system protein Kup n=1 Tax=Lactococcus lactis subsp. hordniae TaxID=203404 RepID=A0A5M9Q455_LACLH|nr:potassium transporter Kup [Lactococcus lactis]KAA8703404.1 potassium transporter Kup [Lactococcus lactis subsp. hordniae]MCT3135647.1 potassium transporter Kup [Lactococcus lactis]